ncbi:hypothetical protein [Brucella pituitosa]|uniref:hypothetical protein n=1 Tax=Brucella pituitosa TaxID=571256 RepID=UPI0009A1F910|nr:hypothetical protein [Brucella pituitosa]
MDEMTLEQKRAVAMASARLRLQQQGGNQSFTNDGTVGPTIARGGRAMQPSIGEDVAKAGASGLARGVADLTGLPGTVSDGLNYAAGQALKIGYEGATGTAHYFEGKGFSPDEPEPGSFFAGSAVPDSIGSGNAMRGYMSDATNGATDYHGKTRLGQYAGTLGEFLPGAAAFGGLSAPSLIKNGIVPAIASEAAGQATEGTAWEPYARMGAAVISPMGEGLLNKAISPNGGAIGAARAGQIQTLENEGIQLTAGQKTGNKNLAYAENMTGGRSAQNMIEEQAHAFTDAAMRKAGGAGLATPDNLADLQQSLSDGFDAISKRNTLTLDKGMVNDFIGTVNRYGNKLDALKKPVFDRVRTEIVQQLVKNKGVASGEWYQQVRSDLGQLAQSARGNDNLLSGAFKGLRDALDGAMDRSIEKTNAPDSGVWRELRRKWGNFKVVANAANGAGGEAAGIGIISPAQLARAAKSGKNGIAYAIGKSDFTDLVKAGQSLMTPLPNSGTAQRLYPMMSTGTGASIGTKVGSMMGMPMEGAAAGAIIGKQLPKISGAVLMSKPVQSYLANQLRGQTRPIGLHALASALLEYDRAFSKTDK